MWNLFIRIQEVELPIRSAGSTPVRALGGNLTQEFQLLEGAAGALGHGAERILGDMDGEACGLGEKTIKAAQKRTAAGEDETAVHKVG